MNHLFSIGNNEKAKTFDNMSNKDSIEIIVLETKEIEDRIDNDTDFMVYGIVVSNYDDD